MIMLHTPMEAGRGVMEGYMPTDTPTYCGAETMAMEAKKPLVSPRARVPTIGQISLTKTTGSASPRG